MKTKIAKFGPYVLLGLIFLMLIFLNIFYQDHWLDSDMAAEMTEYTQQNILDQAAVSVLSQANDMPQQILSLLQ